MNTRNQLERAEQLLSRWLAGMTYPTPKRLDIAIEPDEILPAVRAMVDASWGYLAAITGLDPGVETETLWVLYHFAEGAEIVTLRVAIPRELPVVPTIRHLVPLAGIYEQELSEVLGVEIAGVEDNGRLFLPDDWPDDVYPLRKDFQIDREQGIN